MSDTEARLRAVEIMIVSFMVQQASQWGNDAVQALDQWQAGIVEHHAEDADGLNGLFEQAIRRFT